MLLTLSLLPLLALASSVVDNGSFANPPAAVRPRFRYWLPDASVDIATVQKDIKAASSIGAGGIELVPFYNYGGQMGGIPPGSNWTKFGFGTEAFRDVFVGALRAHHEAGLAFDFALGPNQGQGVPASYDDKGLEWDLYSRSSEIPHNGSFVGTIPGWKTGEFVALVSAEVLSSKTRNWTSTSTTGASTTSYTQLTLLNGSLSDQSHHVSANGQVSFHFPSSKGGYRLFAFYQDQPHSKNLEYSGNVSTSIFANGSYSVDHFSVRGAETTIRFWEQHMLTSEIKQLLREAGEYAWEDSIEILSTVSWTPALPQMFQRMHGYSINRILPLLLFRNNNIGLQTPNSGTLSCILDTPDEGQGYVNDYHGVLIEGYRNYLRALTEWAHSRLGLQFSAQVSYNLPMDMEANIPFVDVPEWPATLAGRNVISNEMGAVLSEAYRSSLSTLLSSIDHAVAGGVNQFIIHGQSYSGNYYNTTWPGYTAFNYLFSEQHSQKQPSWDHGFEEVLNYIGRLQYTQQHGVVHNDVAVYNKVSMTEVTFPTPYSSNDLLNHGYTYTYLSPDNFALPQAFVKNGTLAPDGPSYRALIIDHTANLTLAAVKQIRKFALAGLPVILHGGDPGVYLSGDGSCKRDIEEAIVTLKKTRHVYFAAQGQTASTLVSIGIAPQVRPHTNGTWFTTWRQGDGDDLDYLFVFSKDSSARGKLEIRTNKTPYYFDLWTGDITPCFEYQRKSGLISIPLHLAAGQTKVIGLSTKKRPGIPLPSSHVTVAPRAVVGYEMNNCSDKIEAHIAAGHPDGRLELSNGKKKQLGCSLVSPRFTLSNWTLTAEHWKAPVDMSDASAIADKHNTTHHLKELVSWRSIQGLQNASGVGYYATRFTWPPQANGNTTADGAYLKFPPVRHALRVAVNGKNLPPLDFNAPAVDISQYLRGGQNDVMAVVPTTMWNYIRSIFYDIENGGVTPFLVQAGRSFWPSATDNGLVGSVEVVPIVKMAIGA